MGSSDHPPPPVPSSASMSSTLSSEVNISSLAVPVPNDDPGASTGSISSDETRDDHGEVKADTLSSPTGCITGTGENGAASASTGTSRIHLLPSDFSPGKDDVICGRGKKCYSHIGNERFRVRVSGMLNTYNAARSKVDKSAVLSDVVEQVRSASPNGGFVKLDVDTGRWYEVGDFLAREKTSQAFRDALHPHYKSSTLNKKRRRQSEQARSSDRLLRMGGLGRSYSAEYASNPLLSLEVLANRVNHQGMFL
jgi:hypothetical protein